MINQTKFTIELNEKHLQAISSACEAVYRISLGQFYSMLWYCLDKENKSVYDYDLEKELTALLKPKMGLLPGQSWGVGKSRDMDLLWEIHKVILHFLTWRKEIQDGNHKEGERRDFSKHSGCHYDEPMSYTGVPFIKIEEQKPTTE